MNILDHHVISNMERTGHPDGKEPTYPRCPACGEECEIVYRRYDDGECVGCDACLQTKDAWGVDLCFPEGENE